MGEQRGGPRLLALWETLICEISLAGPMPGTGPASAREALCWGCEHPGVTVSPELAMQRGGGPCPVAFGVSPPFSV